MRNSLVKYDNDFYKINFQISNIHEETLLYWSLARLRESGEPKVSLTIDELKEAAGFSPDTRLPVMKEFIQNYLLHASQMRFHYDYELTKLKGFINLYSSGDFDEVSGTLTLALNSEFEYLVNKVTSNYTAYQYLDYYTKRTPVSKRLFTELSRLRDLGQLFMEVEELRTKLGIAESYTVTKFTTKFLDPAVEEVSADFPGLKYEKMKRGNKIKRFKFTWDKKFQKDKKEAEIIEATDARAKKTKKTAEAIGGDDKMLDKRITFYIRANYDKLGVPADFDWRQEKIGTVDEFRSYYRANRLLSFMKKRINEGALNEDNVMGISAADFAANVITSYYAARDRDRFFIGHPEVPLMLEHKDAFRKEYDGKTILNKLAEQLIREAFEKFGLNEKLIRDNGFTTPSIDIFHKDDYMDVAEQIAIKALDDLESEA